jgi:hypothetical protein
MKITSFTRRLAATLVAGGVFVSTAIAAPLGTNLIENPGFEIVGTTGSNGAYLDAPGSSWSDGLGTNYAYAHSTGYANGTLASGGLYFFNPNFASGVPGGDVRNPGEVAQLIDVSSGDTAAAIASGTAAFSLSGYFSSYRDQGDIGFMQIDFLDGASMMLGSPVVLSDSDATTWTFESTSGAVPVGTASILVSLYGSNPFTGGGPDGYIDNVSLVISAVPEPTTIALAGLGCVGLGLLSRHRRSQNA